MIKELKITDNQELDHNLKNVKVDETSSALSLSKEKVKTKDLEVDGTLTVNGSINGALRSDGELNLESNGTINLTSSTSSVDNDINLNTGGRDLTILNGEEKVIAFSNGGAIVPTLVLYAWNGNTADYFQISSGGNNGETTISTVDAAAAAAHLTIDPDGELNLQPATYTKTLKPLFITEDSAAAADIAGDGQLWVKNSSPNELAFTDDAGTDIVGIGKYQYQFMPIGFYSTTTSANYLPLTGYILERTSTAGQNEYISYIAPYNGTIEKIIWRSEIAQDGNVRVMIYESADGTEVPSSNTGRYDTTVDIADDTTHELNLATASATSGDNNIDKHKIYAISIQFPSAPYDTNVSVVWKWDITS